MELKKNHKVKMAKFHNGVQIGGNVFSSLPRAGFDAKCELSPGWTSFAGVFGSILTMAFIWFVAHILRKNQLQKNAKESFEF